MVHFIVFILSSILFILDLCIIFYLSFVVFKSIISEYRLMAVDGCFCPGVEELGLLDLDQVLCAAALHDGPVLPSVRGHTSSV